MNVRGDEGGNSGVYFTPLIISPVIVQDISCSRAIIKILLQYLHVWVAVQLRGANITVQLFAEVIIHGNKFVYQPILFFNDLVKVITILASIHFECVIE
ncbi:MAG: hypothetical protein ACOCXH_14770 [Cyclobacteriaceae bacterium]